MHKFLFSRIHDPHKETKIAADASSFGLGVVVLQEEAPGDLYRSYHGPSTECKYAQVEKEA